MAYTIGLGVKSVTPILIPICVWDKTLPVGTENYQSIQHSCSTVQS